MLQLLLLLLLQMLVSKERVLRDASLVAAYYVMQRPELKAHPDDHGLNLDPNDDCRRVPANSSKWRPHI